MGATSTVNEIPKTEIPLKEEPILGEFEHGRGENVAELKLEHISSVLEEKSGLQIAELSKSSMALSPPPVCCLHTSLAVTVFNERNINYIGIRMSSQSATEKCVLFLPK